MAMPMITTNFFRPRNWFFVWPTWVDPSGATGVFLEGEYLNDQPSEQLPSQDGQVSNALYASEFLIPDPFCFQAGLGTVATMPGITGTFTTTKAQVASQGFFQPVLGLTQLVFVDQSNNLTFDSCTINYAPGLEPSLLNPSSLFGDSGYVGTFLPLGAPAGVQAP